MKVPTYEECIQLLEEAGAADRLLGHSLRVHSVAMGVCDTLEKKGVSVDRDLVSAAALLHDIRKIHAREHHATEGGDYLRERGMSRVAAVVDKHVIGHIGHPELTPTTTEEKIIFYADLRANPGKIVPLEERFSYVREKYPHLGEEKIARAFDFAKAIEREFLEDNDE